MPAKKVPAKKQSEILEEETKKMENIMAMLRGQIEEERAKVQSTSKGGHRWAAAAEGPIGNFDPHGKLARQILSKKKDRKPQSPSQQSSLSPPQSKRNSPRSRSEKSAEGGVSPPSTSKSSMETSTARTKGKIEVVVEPQGGKLWGHYMADSATMPDEGPQGGGGALWGNTKSECSVQPDEPPSGGSLWGPPPDERAEQQKFQEELARLRGNNSDGSSTETSIKQEEDPNLPPIGAGGALWGPPPNEFLEQQKFQREVAKFRGEVPLPEPNQPAENESTAVGGNLVQKKQIDPSGFTYFDRLVTKNILDGTPIIKSNPPPKGE